MVFGELPFVKPFGQALDWSEEQLDAMSEVQDSDIVAADAHWVLYAPTPFKSLLAATEK